MELYAAAACDFMALHYSPPPKSLLTQQFKSDRILLIFATRFNNGELKARESVWFAR
jgi:hypothetical protein